MLEERSVKLLLSEEDAHRRLEKFFESGGSREVVEKMIEEGSLRAIASRELRGRAELFVKEMAYIAEELGQAVKSLFSAVLFFALTVIVTVIMGVVMWAIVLRRYLAVRRYAAAYNKYFRHREGPGGECRGAQDCVGGIVLCIHVAL